jgi:hypothetical protein
MSYPGEVGKYPFNLKEYIVKDAQVSSQGSVREWEIVLCVRRMRRMREKCHQEL